MSTLSYIIISVKCPLRAATRLAISAVNAYFFLFICLLSQALSSSLAVHAYLSEPTGLTCENPYR